MSEELKAALQEKITNARGEIGLAGPRAADALEDCKDAITKVDDELDDFDEGEAFVFADARARLAATTKRLDELTQAVKDTIEECQEALSELADTAAFEGAES